MTGRRLLAALVALAGLAGAGCGAAGTRPVAAAPVNSTVAPGDRYAAAIDAAAARGLAVWVETDLAKRWLQGPAAFAGTLRRIRLLAARPGVVGVKIADELGYDDGFEGRPAEALAFTRAATSALHAALPGRAVLVDLVIPQLGCAPGLEPVATRSAECLAAAGRRHPAVTLAAVDRLLAGGGLDVVDLSTGLLSAGTYRTWGIDRDRAQRAAWAEVNRRGWAGQVRLQARKALATAGSYPAAAAEADLRTFVDIPLAAGARAVDIWTWRQTYRGEVVRLMSPGLRDNPLWRGLVARHHAGDRLLTHFTPSSVERSVPADLDALRAGFSAVFMAAGTG